MPDRTVLVGALDVADTAGIAGLDRCGDLRVVRRWRRQQDAEPAEGTEFGGPLLLEDHCFLREVGIEQGRGPSLQMCSFPWPQRPPSCTVAHVENRRKSFRYGVLAFGMAAAFAVGGQVLASTSDPSGGAQLLDVRQQSVGKQGDRSASALVDDSSYAQSVRRLYLAFFLREPETDGWTFWIGSGRDLWWTAEYFAVSPEFVARYGSLDDRAFVSLVYRNVMNREPDAGGYQYWTSRMAAGLSRGGVVIYFSDSPEFRQKAGVVTHPATPTSPSTTTTTTTPPPTNPTTVPPTTVPPPGVSTP